MRPAAGLRRLRPVALRPASARDLGCGLAGTDDAAERRHERCLELAPLRGCQGSPLAGAVEDARPDDGDGEVRADGPGDMLVRQHSPAQSRGRDPSAGASVGELWLEGARPNN
mgnify:CR=1 FL=1